MRDAEGRVLALTERQREAAAAGYGLAVAAARKLGRRGFDFESLLDEAVQAMVRVVAWYDPSKGFPLEPLIHRYVHAHLGRWMRKEAARRDASRSGLPVEELLARPEPERCDADGFFSGTASQAAKRELGEERYAEFWCHAQGETAASIAGRTGRSVRATQYRLEACQRQLLHSRDFLREVRP